MVNEFNTGEWLLKYQLFLSVCDLVNKMTPIRLAFMKTHPVNVAQNRSSHFCAFSFKEPDNIMVASGFSQFERSNSILSFFIDIHTKITFHQHFDA